MSEEPRRNQLNKEQAGKFFSNPEVQALIRDMTGLNEEHNLETYLRKLFNAIFLRETKLPGDDKVGKFVTLNGRPLSEATEAEIRKLHSHPNVENLRLARENGVIMVSFYFCFPTKDSKVIGTVDLADMLRCAPRFGQKSRRLIRPLPATSPQYRRWAMRK